jgi:uncharacterized protein (DUF1015 family)
VFLTYRDAAELDKLVSVARQEQPLYDVTAPDGVQHTVWRVRKAEAFVQGFRGVPVAYVADGHHRTASAVRVGRERRDANPAHTGLEDYNWFLAVLFPASQLQILPYNRAVRDLNGRSSEQFLREVAANFSVNEHGSAAPSRTGSISMYLNSKWHDLTWPQDPAADPITRLDVTRLQDGLLAPILGIDDPRTSQRIEFIGGIRGTAELEQRVDSGGAAVAFSMYPTTVDQLMNIADAGQIMPPKSTWFEPKLRSGFFIHTFGKR